MVSDKVAELEREADRFAGCLVGQALGDAVGFIVEGEPPAVCEDYVESIVRPRQFPSLTRGRFSFGQYSDDTQLARELMQSCVERSRFDPEDYARRISAIFTEGRIVGRGRATEAAAYRIAAGIPWEEAGTPAPAAGNGSAMRAAPVGLLFAHDEDALLRVAYDQGRITHRDVRCSAGAIAIAGATAVVVGNPEADVNYLCGKLSKWTRQFDPLLAEAFQQMPGWIQKPPGDVFRTIASIGVEPGHSDGWEGISPFVTGSVLWSLYSVLRSPGDYWEAICTAVAVGGNVDTTAAMTGAIAGAAVGLTALPRDLARLVSDQGEWEYEALVGLAKQLHGLHLRLRQVAGELRAGK
jgi:ADP-ribosylglycohydrolase